LVLYNATEILGVWRLSGTATVLTADQLRALAYPNPRGDAYVCVELEQRVKQAAESELDFARAMRLAEGRSRPFGSPVITSWAALTS